MSPSAADKRKVGDRVFETVAPVLRALGHPNRLRMAHMLIRREMSVGQIAATLKLAHNTTSQHLGIMLDCGILERDQRGRHVYYKVVRPAVRALLQCIWKNAGRL